MATSAGVTRRQAGFLWGMLLLYVAARLCQLYADRLPTLLIVVLHVVPPALFALAHGGILYRWKGIAIFAAVCLCVGTLAEIFSLHTGFPFGHYYFTDVMGPKVFQVPVLLSLAYLGIGYVSWILALLLLGWIDKPMRGMRVFLLPLFASFIMTLWDLSMEPNWSTVDHAWIWQFGGIYFGVPIGNFFGWLVTAYLYYQVFAFYLRTQPAVAAPSSQSYWRAAILIYLVCALGNPLILKMPMAPAVVTDASGKHWLTADVLDTCALVSLLLMAPLGLVAWLRHRSQPAGVWPFGFHAPG